MAYRLESSIVTFSGTDSVTYTYAQSYDRVPVVTATSNQDVNIFVESVTKSSVVIRSSQKGFFSVYVHITDIGSLC